MGFFDPREHPDRIDVELGGQEIPWLLSKEALELAGDEGIEPSDLEASDDDNIQEAMGALARLMYVGTLPFREVGVETPDLDELDRVITPRTAQRVGPKLMKQFQGIEDEEIEATVGKA